MTSLRKEKKISVTTVSRGVKNKGGKCFRCAKRSLLTVRMHEKRQKCCRHFRNDLKSQGNCIVIFANEKNFTLVEHLRCQNRPDVSEVRNVSSNKHQTYMMMLGVVASKKISPVWFETSYKLTTAHYRVILAKKVLPWMRKNNQEC